MATWKRLASDKYTNGNYVVQRSFVALTSTTWWIVRELVVDGPDLRSFTLLRNAKKWADTMARVRPGGAKP